MRYLREKVQTPDGVKVFYRKEANAEDLCPFEVVASGRGVMISGTRPLWLEDNAELERFAQVIAAAWQDHMVLKPKIEMPS